MSFKEDSLFDGFINLKLINDLILKQLQPFAVIAELQSRLAARVFNGKHRLPSRDTMKKWIEKERQYFKEKTAGKFMVSVHSSKVFLYLIHIIVKK